MLVPVCALFVLLTRPKQADHAASEKASTKTPAPQRVSFTRDVAPIVFEKCARCHRPGQAAPFSLLDYAQVKKRGRQIAEVTARRYMPPWLPEPGYGEFADDRRLTDAQIAAIQLWVAQGMPEGDPAQCPPLPRWSDDWQLGPPDLIVDLSAYSLVGAGKDVYRNLVVPIPVSSNRFVKAVELRPGNARVVHHAFINIDETRQSRRRAQKENPPGFDGMDLPDTAGMPGGQLLGWQPGKVPDFARPGLCWVLRTNTDLVLQMHLHPSGKPERVQPQVGFYFTAEPPRQVPFRLRLVRFDFELRPGVSNAVVEQSYVLPVDVDLLRILPHCHYLGKDLQAYALLPNGEKRWLIWIRDWDFNWQGDYRYSQPVSLPKGARLVMHYTYDNSTNNVRNPNSPPKLVRHGIQTTDEMAALALQAVAHNPRDRAVLSEDYQRYFLRLSIDSFEYRLRVNPNDTEARIKLARALFSQGQVEPAMGHLQSVLRLDPANSQAHYEIGYISLHQGRWDQAYREFQAAIRSDPDDYEAFGSLGFICLNAGRKDEARQYLETALRLNPEDAIAQRNLARLQGAR